MGFVKDEDLPIYYRCCDLFIVPTRFLEGFGLVTLEALASGTPVVATPVGGNAEIIKPLNPSWLCHDVSSDSLSKTINNALSNNPNSLEERQKLVDWVKQRYSWKEYANKIQNFGFLF